MRLSLCFASRSRRTTGRVMNEFIRFLPSTLAFKSCPSHLKRDPSMDSPKFPPERSSGPEAPFVPKAGPVRHPFSNGTPGKWAQTTPFWSLATEWIGLWSLSGATKSIASSRKTTCFSSFFAGGLHLDELAGAAPQAGGLKVAA